VAIPRNRPIGNAKTTGREGRSADAVFWDEKKKNPGCFGKEVFDGRAKGKWRQKKETVRRKKTEKKKSIHYPLERKKAVHEGLR